MSKIVANKKYKLQAKAKVKAGRLHMLANTGTPMQLGGFPFPVVVDMEGVRFAQDSTPVIADHDTRQRVGHAVEQSVVPYGKTGIINSSLKPGPYIYAVGVKSSKSQIANEIMADAVGGFPFQISIGAEPEMLELFEEGETATVNGTQYQGPLFVARKSLLYEYTITVLGADRNTKLTIAASKSGDQTMKFEDWLKSLKLEASKLTPEALAQLKAAHAVAHPEPAPAPTPAPGNVPPINANNPVVIINGLNPDDQVNNAIRISAIQAHFQNNADITEICLDGTNKLTMQAFREKALKENWSPDAVELVFLRANRPAQTHQPSSFVDPSQFQSNAIECAIVRNLGIVASDTNKYGAKYGYEHMYDQKTLEAANEARYRSMSLHQLMDLNIAAAGQQYHGNRKSNDYIRAFKNAQMKILASGFSTLAVANILENVGNKVLLAAYQSQETLWSQVTGRRSLNDFKAHSYYRLTVDGGYSKVNQDGQLKHGTFADSKYSLEADTYGMILALTRQTMINDDLDAFNQIPTAIGRLAALALEFAFFEMLLANANSFFHANNKNLITGAGSDLGIPGLTLAAKTFRNQVDTKGKPILTTPSILLVGAQDEILANDLYKQSITENFQAAAAAEQKFTNNPHVNKYRPLVSPMLNNTDIRNMAGAALTGQNENQWYLFANPSVLPAFLVGFLNGVETPVLESEDAPFNTLGMQWRSYHDWGMGQGESRGALRSAGT